jgi:acyl-CoA reductase-like NAD-dependent aldehyde dehydrogenase
VTMGPLHTRKAQIRAEGLLSDASRRGAQVNSLGKIDDDATFARGYFMQPTIVTDLPDDAPLMIEEQFCPAIPVTTYEDVDEAVARANQTQFGLSGSVWSGNVDRAVEIASRIEAGQVWVNTHGPLAINPLAPYGGMKQSGIGRKSGIEGILEYVQSQTITTLEY